MSENIFTRIIENKKNRINILKKSISTDEINERIKQQTKFINFKEKIKKNINLNKTSIIAEIKKASPSAGIIIENYNPIEIAKMYQQNKATCLSILTEEDFFLGNLIHISKVKQKVDLPILCKDFFIDKFQIPLSKSYGSDAILIILAGVNDKSAMELYEEALKYNLTVIVEVHTIEEAKRALRFKDAIIGINNRNLKTLITDLNTTYEINSILLYHAEPIISESGINTKDDIIEIQNKTNIKTFLIGESLLKNLKENSIFSLL
jgi:indole-3-glycerol phosphate synthase